MLIRYNDFINSQLSFWEPHKIAADTRSEFLHGDGTWRGGGEVSIVWIPFNPQISLLGDEYISVDQALSVQLVPRGVPLGELVLDWRVRPNIDERHILTSKTDHFFVVAPFSLAENNWYEVSVTVNLRMSGQTIWRGTKRTKVNALPRTGRISVVPPSGLAFSTQMEVQVSDDWVVRHAPARYQVCFEDSNG